MGRIKIPYVERDGILYPVLTIPKDMELSAVGKYGLLWLSYMKEIISRGTEPLQGLDVLTVRHMR